MLLANCSQSQTRSTSIKTTNEKSSDNKYPDPQTVSKNTSFPMKLSESDWKNKLTPAQYYILREEGTERPFSGKLNHFYQKGTYYSAASIATCF